jgi:short-subunit dehydrogenase
LGRAVAEQLAREGAEVAICSRNVAELEKAAAQIRETAGREVHWRALDVGDSAAVTEFLTTVEER